MSPDDLEKPENATQKAIQLWYTDRWLPIVIGAEYWDESNRHYKLPTDDCTIRKRDGTEETKVLCTIGSEGFGLLIYDNCRDKWTNIMKLKAQNPGKCNEICVMLPSNCPTYIFILSKIPRSCDPEEGKCSTSIRGQVDTYQGRPEEIRRMEGRRHGALWPIAGFH